MSRSRGGPSQMILPAVVAVAAAVALWLLGPSASGQPPTTIESPERLLYQQDCAWCHGADGQGTTFGPSLVGVGAASADFMLRTGRMPIAKVEPQPERRAPTYTPEQIAALVDYVAALGPGPPVPSVDPAAGDLAEGQQLYERNCAACHSSTGFGGALTNGLQAPGLGASSPTEIAEAVRIGGAGLRTGHMPRFGPDILSDQQLDSLVRYVDDLRHPENRGGLGLDLIGPVAEGFVAWAGVLLALLLFTRWIGKRST
jgi:ubiquinol-cytochrome c reductase cytochrome c subunit